MVTASQPLFTIISTGIGDDGPLYRSTKVKLADSLANGEFAPGGALPSERVLADRFGISIGTLRKAVDELVAEGVLVRQQGRGTFVTRHDQQRTLYWFFHVVPHDRGKIAPTSTFVGFMRGEASAEECERLAIGIEDPVFRIRNLVSIEGQGVMIEDLTIAARRFPRMTEARVRERTSTMYKLYQETYGLTVVRTSERLRAVRAPADMARLLDVPADSPLLQIRRMAYGFRDEPLEWRVSHLDTQMHEYVSELAG